MRTRIKDLSIPPIAPAGHDESAGVARKPFTVVLSHDVDRVYKTYQYVTHDLRQGRLDRWRTLFTGERPYWGIDRLMEIEDGYGLRSAFFLLEDPSRLGCSALVHGYLNLASSDTRRCLLSMKTHRPVFSRQVGSYHQYVNQLFGWMESESFVGHDPYDGCNTDYKLLRSHKLPRLLLTYVNKFSPINLRTVLGVKKSRNCYAMALVNLSLHRLNKHSAYCDLVKDNIDHIMSSSLIRDYGYHCWNANGYHIQWMDYYQKPHMPDAIGTEICALALLEHYKATSQPTESIKTTLESARDFFLNVLHTVRQDAQFFRYKPVAPNWELTYNASIKAAAVIAEINRTFGWTEGDDVARACVDFIVSKQRSDGAWMMGLDFRTGRERHQIDFHQGFILDAILRYLDLTGPDARLEEAYLRGVRFYREQQFLDDGRCHYRYPKLYPVNIHNQSQGIITFTQASRFDPSYGHFARTVADWTIEHMRDSRGYFYYHKYPMVTTKIPYMRWSQANMLYALTFLMDEPAKDEAAHEAANVAGTDS